MKRAPKVYQTMRSMPRDRRYVATVVNPVDRRPYAIFLTTKYFDTVHICNPVDDPKDAKAVGAGFFGADERFRGCVRSHTPTGVTTKGVGLGTVLYFGLALASSAVGRGCIYSPDDEEARSPSAAAWWDRSVEGGIATAHAVSERTMDRLDAEGNRVDVLDARSVLSAGVVVHVAPSERGLSRLVSRLGGLARMADRGLLRSIDWSSSSSKDLPVVVEKLKTKIRKFKVRRRAGNPAPDETHRLEKILGRF